MCPGAKTAEAASDKKSSGLTVTLQADALGPCMISYYAPRSREADIHAFFYFLLFSHINHKNNNDDDDAGDNDVGDDDA